MKPRPGLGIGLIAFLALCTAAAHADPDDPFDPANKAPVLGPRTIKLTELIRFDVKASPAKVRRGEVVRITLTGTTANGHHTYPITKITNSQPPSDVTIKYTGFDGIRPLWPIDESEPELVFSPLDKQVVFEHDKPFTWSQDLLIDENAKPGERDITITINNLQVCNIGTCFGPDVFKPLYVRVEILPGEPATPTKAITDRLQGPPTVKVITPSAKEIAEAKERANKRGTDNPSPPSTDVDANNLWSFLGFAVVSALLMLLTPCVFPMIPITVNFFIKQSEKEHHNPLPMALVYSGTIIALLTTIMLALGSVVIQWANNEWFNIGLGLMLIIFALSLFGMYEIELPHFLSRYTSAREGQGGLLGAMFMAMTFTITSFTCTGPFLGLMLGSVALADPPRLNLVLGALVYSATFAAPFFALAMFPSVLKKLPKSGSWLNSVKVTMGFLELGAALKFLSNADIAFFPGNPQLFNYDTVLAAWIALSIVTSAYLFGLFRLPNDDKVENIGVIRMLIAVGFLTLSIYLGPAMLGFKPAGVIGDNVVAFLPLRTGHESDAAGSGGSGPASPGGQKGWYLDYDDARKEAIASDKLIFIDFTGAQCSNCRYNEGSGFPLPQVKEALNKFVKLSLYTDIVPNAKLSASEAKQQGARNMAWQDALAEKDLALPTYIMFRPSRDDALENGVPKGTIVGRAKGAILDVPGFVNVLKNAQSRMTARLGP
jgi:thiol:disulfide interchange protein DsbD